MQNCNVSDEGSLRPLNARHVAGGLETIAEELASGLATKEQLLRARVLSLFLNAVSAISAHAEGLRALEYEAIVGLHRTMID